MTPQRMIPALVLQQGPLSVQTLPLVDRVGHEVRFTTGPTPWPLLRSVEGDANQAWPPSPPFQQLVWERFASDRSALFGVGMAGRGHWSASIHFDQDGSLVFDMACRTEALPESLGSCYQIAPDATLCQTDGGIHLTGPLQGHSNSGDSNSGDSNSGDSNSGDSIGGDSIGTLRLSWENPLSVAWMPEKRQLVLSLSVLEATVGKPVTYRWKYRLQIP